MTDFPTGASFFTRRRGAAEKQETATFLAAPLFPKISAPPRLRVKHLPRTPRVALCQSGPRHNLGNPPSTAILNKPVKLLAPRRTPPISFKSSCSYDDITARYGSSLGYRLDTSCYGVRAEPCNDIRGSFWRWAWLLGSSSGCLFVHHSTRVVRDKEQPRAVQFESEGARTMFEAGLADVKSHANGMENPQITAVPFLFWYSRSDKLSDTAMSNDQILACDTNGDGIISNREGGRLPRTRPRQRAEALNAKGEKSEVSIAQHPEAHVPPGIIVK